MRAILFALLLVPLAAVAAEHTPEVIEVPAVPLDGDTLTDWVAVLGPTLAVIVGAWLGFGGVIRGQRLNAQLARDRDDRLREQEARAMASALSAEIDCLKVEFDANRELYAEGMKDRLTLNREILRSLVLPAPTIFDSVAPRLGLFPTELTLMVVSVYGAFAATGHKLTTAAAIKGDITLDPDDEGDQGLLDAFAAAVVLAKQTEKGLKAFAAGNWTPPDKAEDDA